ncbi:DUF3108 domain-containing protein [Thiovibrio sp. JS02]
MLLKRERLKRNVLALAVLCLLVHATASLARLASLPDEDLLATAYGGGEQLRYRVSWLGLTAGELFMEIRRLPGETEQYALEVIAKSAGLLAVFYPIEDRFLTIVEGRQRLPVLHEMDQREGRRENRKLTLYDQETYVVTYQKNEEEPEVYQLDGPAHNEFSSFFFLRALGFSDAAEIVVPTFADKKRHEVVVSLEGGEEIDTVFGRKKTVKVQPHLKFKGLYEKVGDPLIWLTDDARRIPVRIEARIVIGSLTSRLVEYRSADLCAKATDSGEESPAPSRADSD